MNWVLIAVFAVLIFYMFYGYRKGIVRIVYSMVSGILVLVLVALAAPQIADFLKENTQMHHQIAQRCEGKLRRTSAESMQALAQNIDSIKTETLAEMGIHLPEMMVKRLFEQTDGMAKAALEGSGIYTAAAYNMADFVMKGISFLVSWICSVIVVSLVSNVLNIFSHIPIISEVNRFAGVAAGGIYGLMLVWIAFAIVAFCSSSEWGAAIMPYIHENAFLTCLYENNLILLCILKFF